MREFRSWEDGNGNVTVYGRDDGGLGNEPWLEVGVVPFDERYQGRPIDRTAECLGLAGMNGTELARLSDELAWPRRW